MLLLSLSNSETMVALILLVMMALVPLFCACDWVIEYPTILQYSWISLQWLLCFAELGYWTFSLFSEQEQQHSHFCGDYTKKSAHYIDYICHQYNSLRSQNWDDAWLIDVVNLSVYSFDLCHLRKEEGFKLRNRDDKVTFQGFYCNVNKHM